MGSGGLFEALASALRGLTGELGRLACPAKDESYPAAQDRNRRRFGTCLTPSLGHGMVGKGAQLVPAFEIAALNLETTEFAPDGSSVRTTGVQVRPRNLGCFLVARSCEVGLARAAAGHGDVVGGASEVLVRRRQDQPLYRQGFKPKTKRCVIVVLALGEYRAIQLGDRDMRMVRAE